MSRLLLLNAFCMAVSMTACAETAAATVEGMLTTWIAVNWTLRTFCTAVSALFRSVVEYDGGVARNEKVSLA